jgi:2-polyprenyl-3-methyl-5-hydroxy-6-metoxy-1,4-benzoquinol methylase
LDAEQGAKVRVRVRQDRGQIHFAAVPGACRPRHAHVPRWHFDMVLDGARNAAYEAAIRRAVEFRRSLSAAEVNVLDMGAGSGILSLMAARFDSISECQLRMSKLHWKDT